MFNPGDLWEHINGAAEHYLAYGFQDLATTRYTSDKTRTAVVAEIYRMGDVRGAFGIYRQEVSPKARPIALGVEGRASSNTIRFWTGEYYVKLTTPPGGGRMQELEALGGAIAKGLGAPGAMPAEVGWFPSAGQLPDSVRFIPADALGQAAFTNAFEAKYEHAGEPATAIVVPFDSETAAASALARYESFLSKAPGRTKVGTPGDGGFSATDSFQGFILAVRAGSRLVVGSPRDAAVSGALRGHHQAASAGRRGAAQGRWLMTHLDRRGFVRASAAAAAAAMVRPALAAPLQDAPGSVRVRRLKPLGRTGWRVGDVSAGSGQRDPAVLNYIFESGINLMDTGFQYAGHEELIGKVLPKWRDKVFVLDEWDPPLIAATVTKSALEALDVSLQRLNTTYVDCMMLHSIGHPRYSGLERIQNPAIYEAWDEAKRLGKVRFTGASSHSIRMIEDMSWGLDNDRFDVILIGANFLTRGVAAEEPPREGDPPDRHEDHDNVPVRLNVQALQNEQTNARQACLKSIFASICSTRSWSACGTTTRWRNTWRCPGRRA